MSSAQWEVLHWFNFFLLLYTRNLLSPSSHLPAVLIYPWDKGGIRWQHEPRSPSTLQTMPGLELGSTIEHK